MKLNGEIGSAWPNISIDPLCPVETTIGPVQVLSKRQIYWKIKALENGHHHLIFQVNEHQIEKELSVGDDFRRVSFQRPGWQWSDILLHPSEKPFGPDSVVQSISISYPDRLSRTSGTDWWLAYFFAASMVFALLFKPFLKVRI